MTITKDICLVCAWRENCQKRFSVRGKDFRCPDFVRDITLPKDDEETEKAHSKQKGREA